jgi:hypothetical protein
MLRVVWSFLGHCHPEDKGSGPSKCQELLPNQQGVTAGRLDLSVYKDYFIDYRFLKDSVHWS